MKVKHIILGLISLLFLAVFGFCTVYLVKNYPRSIEEGEYTLSQPRYKVLVASQGSDFKTPLLEQLATRLNSNQASCKVVNLKNLKKERIEDYDKVIVINSFIVKLNRRVAHFIDQSGQPDKILLLVTSGGADWQPEPDLEVDALTAASHLEYSQPLINLILSWVTNPINTPWEPEDYIEALQFFAQVTIDQACRKIRESSNEYKAHYDNLESKLNQLGYYYVRLNQLESASLIFKLNMDLFPDKANVYDSYAESLYLLGNTPGAIEHYQKALELDPNLNSSKNMLQKLTATCDVRM